MPRVPDMRDIRLTTLPRCDAGVEISGMNNVGARRNPELRRAGHDNQAFDWHSLGNQCDRLYVPGVLNDRVQELVPVILPRAGPLR